MIEQELYHAWLKKGEAKDNHKYVRREWKNGRWVYYYDSNKLKNDVRNAVGINQKRAYENASRNTQLASLRRSAEIVNFKGTHNAITSKNSDNSYRKYLLDQHNENKRNLTKRTKEYVSAKVAEDKAFDNYIGTPLSYITHPSAATKKAIDNGRAYVNNLLSKKNKTSSNRTSSETLYDIGKANAARRELGITGSGATLYDMAKVNERLK